MVVILIIGYFNVKFSIFVMLLGLKNLSYQHCIVFKVLNHNKSFI